MDLHSWPNVRRHPRGPRTLGRSRAPSLRRCDLASEDRLARARDEFGHRVRFEGSREEVALAKPATQIPQSLELGRSFDPFGHGRQAERPSDLHDRADDSIRPLRIVERSHK